MIEKKQTKGTVAHSVREVQNDLKGSIPQVLGNGQYFLSKRLRKVFLHLLGPFICTEFGISLTVVHWWFRSFDRSHEGWTSVRYSTCDLSGRSTTIHRGYGNRILFVVEIGIDAGKQ